MSYFHTCQRCATKATDCATRAKIAAAIAGLGVGSIKHRCRDRVPLYTPGAAVLVKTRPWLSSQYPEYEDEPPIYWFRGRFIRYSGASLIVFVAPGTPPEDGDEEHVMEPQGSGFIKAPRTRVKTSDWADPISVEPCRWCSAITTLGQNCGRDPHYTPRGHCQAEMCAAAEANVTEPQSTPTPASAPEADIFDDYYDGDFWSAF